ncbi:MAG: ThuA domain-containing protein [Planctomycetaceae bacterium]|nr:ThuA domain-containing protein [Planctomycetaceae bacterium]
MVARYHLLTLLIVVSCVLSSTGLSNSFAWQSDTEKAKAPWPVQLRSRVPSAPGSPLYHAVLTEASWNPLETAVIVCDMWDNHHSPNAVDRVNELAPAIEAYLNAARRSGAVIIHAPSDCMAFYVDHPARDRAQSIPIPENVPDGFERWCTGIPSEAGGVYPIDQADGGEDDDPDRHAAWAQRNKLDGRNPNSPWKQQHAGITIDPANDYITDLGPEVWAILETRGIKNVALVGVHVNMCVLGRPFGLRNLIAAGKQAVLVRDLTDSMYNPARWPYVHHHTGTDLIIQHIEKFVCPTMTSDQLVGGQQFRFSSDRRIRLAILVAEPEYETERSLPRFAANQLGQDFQVEFVFGSSTDADFPGLHLLRNADAAMFSVRRRPLRANQMQLIRDFVQSGKPMIGIRTASHSFHLRSEQAESGLVQWPEFDAEVWGGNYTGHFGNELLPQITSVEQQATHWIMDGQSVQMTSSGSLYKTLPLKPGTTPLLLGTIAGQEPQPVAWTYTRADGGRSFYTSLGHVGDFEQPVFQEFLTRGIYWVTQQELPKGMINRQGFWQSKPPNTMPATRVWQMQGDAADQMVAGIDRFLLRKWKDAGNQRLKFWHDTVENSEREKSLDRERQRLAKQLGVQLPTPTNPSNVEMRLVATPDVSSLVGSADNFEIYRVTWRSFGNVWSHGLLAKPKNRSPRANVLAIPDCEVWPEQLIGLSEGVPPAAQYARRLADGGCQVLIPLLVNRQERLQGITNREWLYRPAFEMGRSLIGYELQELISAVDWFRQSTPDLPVGSFGYGEGGLLSLYLGALDERVATVAVSGYFGPRNKMWNEPLDRNLFGNLPYFADAELAAMIAPRAILVEAVAGPSNQWQGGRGAPSELTPIPLSEVQTEWDRIRELLPSVDFDRARLIIPADTGNPGSTEVLRQFVATFGSENVEFSEIGPLPKWAQTARLPDREHGEKIASLDRHTQELLQASRSHRDVHVWSRFNFSSLAEYEESTQSLRQEFYETTIGRFPDPLLDPNPQSRLLLESEKWTAYEVALDVFPDVIAYGLLLIPKDLKVGERRPVVVCQHGLEGRPQDTIGEPGFSAYKAFAAKLAEEGFITFAPQNPYIFGDRFRTLQRKANPLGKTLFSIITPQHQQIVNWLRGQPFVDQERIAFYGLSYGGKTAMRVPAIVTDYCLSICSADFNEWVDKNASTSNPRSYVNTGEYEIFEFDLGHTFNYAEMAALIAPRPFMVERGHEDGVADDWTVAWEYARVRNLYAAKLKIPERTEIEWFAGPHTINGQKTFEFLKKHLRHD